MRLPKQGTTKKGPHRIQNDPSTINRTSQLDFIPDRRILSCLQPPPVLLFDLAHIPPKFPLPLTYLSTSFASPTTTMREIISINGMFLQARVFLHRIIDSRHTLPTSESYASYLGHNHQR